MVTMQAYWPRATLRRRSARARRSSSSTPERAKPPRARPVDSDPPQHRCGVGARHDPGLPRKRSSSTKPSSKPHTGAPFLVDAQGKLMREKADDANSYLVFDAKTKAVVRHDAPGVDPMLVVAGEKLPAGVRTVFTMLLDEADPWTLDKTSEETEIPKDVIAQLAREYAKSGASMIIANMGTFQRIEYGTYAAACTSRSRC